MSIHGCPICGASAAAASPCRICGGVRITTGLSSRSPLAVAIAPDGGSGAWVDADGVVRVWGPVRIKPWRPIPADVSLEAAAVTADGQTLMGITEGRLLCCFKERPSAVSYTHLTLPTKR